jgi:hypothetical protein
MVENMINNLKKLIFLGSMMIGVVFLSGCNGPPPPPSNVSIDAPLSGEIINESPYNDMHGTFEKEIPSEYTLWVIARDQYNYFLMYPPTQVNNIKKEWSQTNIRLTPGRWELNLCVANKEASSWLEGRAKRGVWDGFPSLPKGMDSVQTVTVEMK